MAFTFRFAEPFAQVKGSPIRELFRYLSQPGMISFAGGYPAPELFDVAGLQNSLEAIARNPGTTLSYGATEGWPALRESFARLSTEREIATDAEQVMVTSGSQQGFDLLLRAFIEPGDTVVVERPTYPAALQGLRLAGAQIVTVASGTQGPDLAELTTVLKQHQPKLLYLVPTFANPTGATINLQGRRQLLDLLLGSSCVLIEDDPYGELRFGGTPVPTLAGLAQDTAVADQIVYLSSLSKIIAPGLRLGWMRAHADILRRCVLAKQVDDLCSAPYLQAVAAHYLDSGRYGAHLPTISSSYGERARLMIDSLRQHFGSHLTLLEPEGGMFLWGRLHDGLDATALLPLAIEENVMFVPGSAFYAEQPDPQAFRLSFTMSSPQQIVQGCERLFRAVQRLAREQAAR
ncbi:2-aminoadipate aminotransferase [Advenella sp. S44]|uniref:aminotransferase-like domain-containing protein n=1 Tax=Advenella sp. S44 TaxID=1982755 RepID=UPI000C296C85|nr:PLP-dependent aminotransferase family protein [Advenella sp. S44]PJX27816.1 2-aminoadipate aminotransferase [Advenella sp. S44]